jgi:hypothetical protein
MIKSKHFLVISFSSIIIGLVLVSTVIVHTLYVEWKNNSFIQRYNSSISKLTAEMLRKDISIANVKVGLSKEGPFSGLPFVEGSLKNNSGKTITSLRLEMSFKRPDGSVVYKDWLHPIGEERFFGSSSFPDIEHTKNVLLPGENISFSHLLRNCSPEVVSQFSLKKGFAKTDTEDKVRLEYSITRMTAL